MYCCTSVDTTKKNILSDYFPTSDLPILRDEIALAALGRVQLSQPFSILFFTSLECYPMDHQDVQQQQKDFFNTLFTSDVGAENPVQRGNEPHHPTMYGGALPPPSQTTMRPSHPVIPNVPLEFELVTQLMGIQGQQSGSIGQGQYSPQLVLEQRLKLNQLQQLQLQNQILQQQVRRILSPIVRLFNELALCPFLHRYFLARILEWPGQSISH
jgi:hypothetical protein